MLFYDFADSGIIDGWVDVTLHHCASLIVLNIALPSVWAHPAIFAEPLLSEVAESKVVGIGHEILNFPLLHFLLELVHEAGAVASDLLIGCDC